jgi:hypothetical protein
VIAKPLNHTALTHWRANPIEFIETVLCDPETNKPFVLLPAERAFLEQAFKLDGNGGLLYPEQLYGAPKKSGKTGFAALHVLTTILLFGGAYGEAYALANDQEQAQSRVFQAHPPHRRVLTAAQARGQDYAGQDRLPRFLQRGRRCHCIRRVLCCRG